MNTIIKIDKKGINIAPSDFDVELPKLHTERYPINQFYFNISEHQTVLKDDVKLDFNWLKLKAERSNKKLLLVGKGGCGKNYLQEKLIEFGMIFETSTTTRPIRNGEIEGREYFYKTFEEFEEMVKNDEFISFTKYKNNHFYGITKTEFEKCNLFILHPRAIMKFTPYQLSQCIIVYIDISDDIILERLNKRENFDVKQRVDEDAYEFDQFNLWNIKITNPNF